MTLGPGDVYWAELDGAGRHFAIVVSRERFNEGGYAMVVPVTSERFEQRSQLRNCVPFRAGEACFKSNCVAQAENLTMIETALLDTRLGPVARLRDDRMRDVIRAIGFVIEAECEPE